MRPGGQGYRSMVGNERVEGSSGKTASPDMLNLIASVPNWSVSNYRASYWGVSDACRYAGMLLCSRTAGVGRRRIVVACVMIRTLAVGSDVRL